MAAKQERWRELAEVKRELAEREWFPATSGNLSIKVTDEPLTFLVTASGKDKRKETVEDFLLVDQNGEPAESGHSLKPSAETLLHTHLYNKTNAGCCLHVHTVNNNVISELYGDQKKITFKIPGNYKSTRLVGRERRSDRSDYRKSGTYPDACGTVCGRDFRRFRSCSDPKSWYYGLGENSI